MHICMLNTFRLLILSVIKAFNVGIWRCNMAVPQYNLALTGKKTSTKTKFTTLLSVKCKFLWFHCNAYFSLP